MITQPGLRATMDACTPLEGAGKELHRTKNLVKAVWDFAVQGGATGTLNLKDDLGNEITLPSGAILKDGVIDVLTAMSSAGGAGTIALGCNTTTDLKGAVDADTLSGRVAIIPVGTAATAVKLTADRKVQLTIGTEALIGGKIAVYIEYYAS